MFTPFSSFSLFRFPAPRFLLQSQANTLYSAAVASWSANFKRHEPIDGGQWKEGCCCLSKLRLCRPWQRGFDGDYFTNWKVPPKPQIPIISIIVYLQYKLLQIAFRYISMRNTPDLDDLGKHNAIGSCMMIRREEGKKGRRTSCMLHISSRTYGLYHQYPTFLI